MADFGVLHCNELSGALPGLTWVWRFQQDDAHIFCMPEQVRSHAGHMCVGSHAGHMMCVGSHAGHMVCVVSHAGHMVCIQCAENIMVILFTVSSLQSIAPFIS